MGKSKKRKERTQAELRRASLAVQYDLVMLHSCLALLQSSNVGWSSNNDEKQISNAILHAMLLAARNLLSFLFAHRPRESDIIAEDFFDDSNIWQKQRAVPSPEMADGVLISRISKRLVHLTWDRADRTKPLWGGFRIVWSIGLVLQSFVQLADDAKIHEQLREDVGAMMALLKKVLDQHKKLGGQMAPAMDSMCFDDLVYFGDDDFGGGVAED